MQQWFSRKFCQHLGLFLAVFVVLLSGCGQKPSSGALGPLVPDSTDDASPYLSSLLRHDTTLIINHYAVEIRVPEGAIRGDLLLLPGWNYTRTKWCEESRVCSLALANGYRIVMPEMGKSLYAGRLFEETTPDLRQAPTRTWLTDTVFQVLRDSLGVLLANGNNAVLGLSTGGRGVIMVLLDEPLLFRAGAALSGDYDLPSMPNERINIAMYGPLSQFSERWRGIENPMDRLKELKTPLYLGHGGLDNVVDVRQTTRYYSALRAAQPELNVQLHIDSTAAHTFEYWDSELDEVFAFFNRNM
jgi:pimeloyl-ACP methyl ester carboxylesterase